jgi:hypothetical protein
MHQNCRQEGGLHQSWCKAQFQTECPYSGDKRRVTYFYSYRQVNDKPPADPVCPLDITDELSKSNLLQKDCMRLGRGGGELLAESLGDVSVQTMPLCNGGGCRTFQTASHIHVIQIWGVWSPSPSTVGDEHMDAHSLRYNHRHFPRFGRVSRKSRWCKCANHATSQWLRL